MCKICAAANDFTVKLILRDSEVRISSMLPVTIPGPFALQVHFISSEAVSREESTYLWDQSLVNSREIDVAIPKGKLPTFLHFSVTVAIRHGTVNGPPTQASNALGEEINAISERLCQQLIGLSSDDPG